MCGPRIIPEPTGKFPSEGGLFVALYFAHGAAKFSQLLFRSIRFQVTGRAVCLGIASDQGLARIQLAIASKYRKGLFCVGSVFPAQLHAGMNRKKRAPLPARAES